MKKIARVLFVALFVSLAFVPRADAAFVWSVAEWDIPFIGTMKAPDGFAAVEVKDFRTLIEQEKKKLNDPKKATKPTVTTATKPELIPEGTPTLLKDALPADEAAAMRRFAKSDVAFYHLTMDDGEAIHMAWLLAARDGEKLPANIDFFTKDLDASQTEKLAELKAWVDANIEKAQYTDPKNKVSVKLLEMLALQPLPMQNGDKAWTAGGRVLVTVEGMPFAFFGRVYVFSVDNQLTVAVLGGFDGERPFWDPVIRDMLLSVQAKPATK